MPNHTNKDAIALEQEIRIQGCYNDNPELCLWTTEKTKKTLGVYIGLLNDLDKCLMDPVGTDETIDMIETQISVSNDRTIFNKFLPNKKKKNFKVEKSFKKNALYVPNDVTNIDFYTNLEKKLPGLSKPNNMDCINEIKIISENDYIDEYGQYEIAYKSVKTSYTEIQPSQVEQVHEDIKKIATNMVRNVNENLINNQHHITAPKKEWFDQRHPNKQDHVLFNHEQTRFKFKDRQTTSDWKILSQNEMELNYLYRNMSKIRSNHLWSLTYDNNGFLCLIVRYTYGSKQISFNSTMINQVSPLYSSKANTPYFRDGTTILVSLLKDASLLNMTKDERKMEIGNHFYKTPDNKRRFHCSSLDLNTLNTIHSVTIKRSNNEHISPIIEQVVSRPPVQPQVLAAGGGRDEPMNLTDTVRKYVNERIDSNPTKSNIRLGLTDIFKNYVNWYQNKFHNNKHEKRTNFKTIFESLGFKDDGSKGVCREGKPGKRGYHLDFTSTSSSS